MDGTVRSSNRRWTTHPDAEVSTELVAYTGNAGNG